jgi:hydrophobe/amphiphile efflux-3 (HAE3) family protein
MKNLRHQVENWFGDFARIIYHHRIKTIVLMGLLIAAMLSQLPNITMDMSTEGFLHKNDPALQAYDRFREQFGRDEMIVIAIQPPEIFDPGFLSTLQNLHEELEEQVPYIEDITSMVNARNTRVEEDELIVEDLLEHWPETEAELAALKERVMSNHLYKNLLISEDGTFTTITIQPLSYSPAAAENGEQRPLNDAENSEMVFAVQEILKKYEAEDVHISLAGSPVVIHFLMQSMVKDMQTFMRLALLTIVIVLFVMFRRISGVLLPLVIVMLSLLSTLGLMAAFGAAIKSPTQILPSFLLAVGVGTSVHILALFFRRLDRSGNKEEAIVYAMGHSGLAVVMTNVTTASGLFSFANADVAPIADLGVFAAIGVLLAFLYTLVLLPALLSLFPIKAKAVKTQQQHTVMDRLLAGIGNLATAHPYSILTVAAMMAILAIVSMFSLHFSHHTLEWFPEDNYIRTATESIDEVMRGTLTLEVVIDTGEENGLYDPDLMNRLEQAAIDIEQMEYEDLFIGKAWSITSILKETNRALHENRPEFYRIPQDRQLIAQELLLFEMSGSDNLEDVVDNQFSMARLTMKVPFKDAYKYSLFLPTLRAYFDTHFPDVKVEFTGMMMLLVQVFSNSIRTMAKSYITALIVITILMVILIGKLRIGLVSMIPNLFPILLMLGMIGWMSFPLDLFTMMIASIAIGLAVDDTIHFMHNFRRYYEHTGDPKAAVHQTLQTTGRAMLVTSVVLSLGFFIYSFATMNNIINFGLLTSFAIVMALVADYFMTPALMVTINLQKALSKEREREQVLLPLQSEVEY